MLTLEKWRQSTMIFSVLIASISLNMGCVHKHEYEGQNRQNVLEAMRAQSELSVNTVIITCILAFTHTACSLITLTHKATFNLPLQNFSTQVHHNWTQHSMSFSSNSQGEKKKVDWTQAIQAEVEVGGAELNYSYRPPKPLPFIFFNTGYNYSLRSQFLLVSAVVRKQPSNLVVYKNDGLSLANITS